MRKTVQILGTHGVPANYDGFATAAENVALYLADQGWRGRRLPPGGPAWSAARGRLAADEGHLPKEPDD
jgi:hypothetical protein